MDTKLCSAVRLAGETVLVVTQTNVDNPLAFACSTIGIESRHVTRIVVSSLSPPVSISAQLIITDTVVWPHKKCIHKVMR